MLKSILLAASFTIALFPAFGAADSRFGVCELIGSELLLGTQIEWDFDPEKGINQARLIGRRETLVGEVVNMRAHDDGVKINMRFFGAEFYDVMEIVVMNNSSVESVGGVRFVKLDGEILVDVIMPFEDAQCVMR